MTAKDRLKELIGRDKETEIKRWDCPCSHGEHTEYIDHFKENKLRSDQRRQIPTTQSQMLEDLKKAWPEKWQVYLASNEDARNSYNRALAQAWVVVERYFGGEG